MIEEKTIGQAHHSIERVRQQILQKKKFIYVILCIGATVFLELLWMKLLLRNVSRIICFSIWV